MKDMLLVVTFDESLSLKHNHIFTAFFGDSVKAGSTSNTFLTNYNLLRTIEDAWDLGTLGRKDSTAQPITDIFR